MMLVCVDMNSFKQVFLFVQHSGRQIRLVYSIHFMTNGFVHVPQPSEHCPFYRGIILFKVG